MQKSFLKISFLFLCVFILSCNNTRTYIFDGSAEFECTASISPGITTLSGSTLSAPVAATLWVSTFGGPGRITNIRELSSLNFSSEAPAAQIDNEFEVDLELKQIGEFDFEISMQSEDGRRSATCKASADVKANPNPNPLSCTASISPSPATVFVNSEGGVVTPAAVTLNVSVVNGPAKVKALSEKNSKTFAYSFSLPTPDRASHALSLNLNGTGAYEMSAVVEKGTETFTCKAPVQLNSSAAPTPSVSMTTESGFSIASVPYGGSINLAWLGTNVSSCKVYKNGVQIPGLTSTSGVFPTGALTAPLNSYTVDCLGPSNPTVPVTSAIAVEARPLPEAHLEVNWANEPSPLAWDGGVDVHWSSEDTVGCDLYKNGVKVTGATRPVEGDMAFNNLRANTTFRIHCNDGLPNYAETSITVPVAGQPVLTLNVSPLSATMGQTISVNWNAQNASNCAVTRTTNGDTLSKGSGNSGSFSESLNATSTYRLSCNANALSTSKTVTVLAAQDCQDIKASNPAANTGVFLIDPDGAGPMGAMNAYCDMTTDGGGWTLVLNYLHQGGTNPELGFRTHDLPIRNQSTLGIDESGTAAWGHAVPSLLGLFSFSESRWECISAGNEGRYIHFATTHAGTNNYIRTGNGSASGIQNSYRALQGHTGKLPGNALHFYYPDQGNEAMTNFPFYKSNGDSSKHWAIKGFGKRWECDNYPNNSSKNTFHQVWIR